MKKTIICILEFLAILVVPINSIQFLIFSFLGINYDPEEGTGLVAILNVSFCLYSIFWVVIQELRLKPIKKVLFPYFFPLFIIFLFLVESLLFDDMKFQSPSGRHFIFFGVLGIPAIYLATFIYRHNRFDLISKYSDIIMIICTLSLILNLPNMYSGRYGSTAIGGGGGHQDISYSAAFCFGINWVNILSGNKIGRFEFTDRIFYRIVCFVFLIFQAIICLLGQGRGGAVLLVVSFIAGLFIYSKKKIGKSLVLSGIVLLIFTILVQSGTFGDGFGRSFNFISDGSIDMGADEERGKIYSLAGNLILDNFFTGVGLWHEMNVTGIYLHNIFMDIMVSGGIFYLILSLFLLKKAYSEALYILKNDTSRSMLLPWMIYPTVLLMFSGYYPSNPFFWFCIVYCLLCRKLDY